MFANMVGWLIKILNWNYLKQPERLNTSTGW